MVERLKVETLKVDIWMSKRLGLFSFTLWKTYSGLSVVTSARKVGAEIKKNRMGKYIYAFWKRLTVCNCASF